MAHPLPNEKALYEHLRSNGITVAQDLWECFYRRITEDTTAIAQICQASVSSGQPIPVSDAQKILACTRDMENIVRTASADSKEDIVFKQFADNIPLHPVIRELFAHQLGNDVYAINVMAGDYADPLEPRSIPPEVAKKIFSHAFAINEFINALKNTLAEFPVAETASQPVDLYRRLYDSFSDGLVRFDMDGKVVECNQAYLQMMGYAHNEITGMTFHDLFPYTWNAIQSDLANTEESEPGVGRNFERECIRKDGTIFPAAIRMWLIEDTGKRAIGVWAIVRDISTTRTQQRAILREVWDTQTVIEKIGEGITLSDTTGHFEIFNSRMRDLTGYTIDEANRSGDFNTLIYPDDEARIKTLSGINEVIEQRGYHEAESVIRTKDGARKTVYVTTSLIQYHNRAMFLSVWRDITAQREAETALRRQEDFTQRLIQGSSVATFVLDCEHKVVIWNAACEAITGLQAREVVGTKNHWKGFYTYQRPCLADFILDNNLQNISSHYTISRSSDFLPRGQHAEDWLTTHDGRERYLIFDAVPILDSGGKTVAVIETLLDDTQKAVAERERQLLNTQLVRSNNKLKELALTDSHTGLYNFRYLEGAIESEFDRSRRQAQPLSVMMLDLDYFKSINDVYGHQFGDYILKLVAIRLRKTIRTYDTVIRYGGEEFIVICPGSDRQNARHLGQRILEEFTSRTFGNDEYTVRIKLSIGIASFPEDSAVKGMALIDLADRVLHKVKESGGNKVFTSVDAFAEQEHLFYDTNDVKSIKAKIERVNKRVNHIVLEELLAFARNSFMRDSYTPTQMEEMAGLAIEIAKDMQMPQYVLDVIGDAAMIHDLGKLGMQDQILSKAGPLTDAEWVLVKQHPQITADILYTIPPLRRLIPAVLNHHERWDGTGYPNGLKADEIPREASIISLVDAYCALCADRPYRKAFSGQEAVAIIEKGSGTQFCPAVVEHFLKLHKQHSPET